MLEERWVRGDIIKEGSKAIIKVVFFLPSQVVLFALLLTGLRQ